MLLTLLLTVSSLAPARVYPIAPVPLHELVARSDLVAVVRPGPSNRSDEAHSFWDTSVELRVEEVLLGIDVPASITTTYEPGMMCPAPPEYPEGGRVLAFLTQDEKLGWRPDGLAGWQPVGLSYGTKVLDLAALGIYRARIRELVALIHAQPERWKETPEFIEWLVRCVEEPSTRWEGAYSIDPTSDYRYGDSSHELPQSFGHRLDAAQKARLSKALVLAPSIEAGEMLLLHFLAADPDPALDEFALARLPGVVQRSLFDARRLVLLVAQRSGDDEAKRMAGDFETRGRGDPADPEITRFVSAFIERVRGLR